MILVTVGTQDKDFSRMLNLVEEQINKKNIAEEVIVQSGHTKYVSDKMKIFDFIPNNQFDKYIKDANIIITHGGVGSIVNSVKLGKKVIAIPRLSKYNEHDNDHQLQICEKFSELGYIKVLNENDDFSKLLKEIEKFKPTKYISNTKNIIEALENYIDNI